MTKCAVAMVTFLMLAGDSSALSDHVGRHYYLMLMGSNHKFPIFTKEFVEGEGFEPVGGIHDLWLEDDNRVLGVRLGYDNVGTDRTGVGLGLSYWRVQFRDATFRYDRVNFQPKMAEYRVPTHSYVCLDFTGSFLPWVAATGRRGIGFQAILSMVGDWEKYYVDKYALTLDGAEFGRTTQKRSKFDLRLGFGFSCRIYFTRRWSLWLEKRWIRGEKYGVERNLEQGGFFSNHDQKTLYSPFNSLGAALAF